MGLKCAVYSTICWPRQDETGCLRATTPDHVMEVVYPQENVETDRDIAFVDHLDVVPADDGWTHDASIRRLLAILLSVAAHWTIKASR